MRIRFIRLVSPVFLAAVLLNACSLSSSTQETEQVTTGVPGPVSGPVSGGFPAGTTPAAPVPDPALHMSQPPAQGTGGAMVTAEPVPGTGIITPDSHSGSSAVGSLIAGLATASDLEAVLDLLLTEHVILEARASGAILSINQAGYSAAADALEANTADLAALLGAVYGPQASADFPSIWQNHIHSMVSYTTALAAHDQERHEQAIQAVQVSTGELGAFFHRLDPNLAEDTATGMFETHAISQMQLIDRQEANDPAAVLAIVRDARGHMGAVARAFARGIATRYPDRFPGEVGGGPAELRSTLTLLLSEHMYLAAEATRAALKGKQVDFEAAAGVLELNAIDLSAAIGSTYGPEAQQAFLPLWRKHIGFAAEYTNSLAKNDTSGQRQALESLLAYPQELGGFLASVNPGLPDDTLADLERDHIQALIQIIDSQNVGNEAAAYSLFREAYAHTGMMAGLLAEGTLHVPAPGAGQAAMVKQVEIKVFAFVPPELEVRVGTTVIWTNQDDTVHTITVGTVGNAGEDFDSSPFGKGESFAYLFTTPGEFPYFCRVHPEMVGLVRVVP